jgi:hypothetical protein
MHIEITDFVTIWDEYATLLPVNPYIYDIYVKIIIKLRNNDTNFNIEENKNFCELVELMAEVIYNDKIFTNIYCENDDYYKQTKIYNEPQLDYCSHLLTHLEKDIMRYMKDQYDEAFANLFIK